MSKTAVNDITGDKIKSKVNSDKFRENFDKIFGPKKNQANKSIKNN